MIINRNNGVNLMQDDRRRGRRGRRIVPCTVHWTTAKTFAQ